MKQDNFFTQTEKYKLFEELTPTEQIQALKKIINDLIEAGDLNDLEFTDQESTDNFKAILWKAKLISL